MQSLTVQEINDYCRCPLLYHFRYRENREIIATYHELLDKALRQTAFYLFNTIQGGTYPAKNYIKFAWGRIWKQKYGKSILSKSVKGISPLVKGLEAIYQMHSCFKSNHGIPILINYEYEIEIDGYKIKGCIDLVREHKRRLELINFQLQKRQAGGIWINHDPILLAAAEAVDVLLKKRVDRMYYYYFFNNELLPTEATANDRNALVRIINSVANGIQHEVFFPVLNDNCTKCPYWSLCSSKCWF